MILMAGQRSCTAWASFNPSMLPGIWMSENKRDVRARFENGQRLVGVDGFDRVEAGILDDVDGAQAQHHLVFDDKNVRHRIGLN